MYKFKVAQYLTALPDKQWFIDKLNKSVAIAQQSVTARGEEKELTGEALKVVQQKINESSTQTKTR